MNKWPRCEDCVRDNYLRAPVCQTCVAGSNFLPRGTQQDLLRVCPGDESAAGSLSRYGSGLAEV